MKSSGLVFMPEIYRDQAVDNITYCNLQASSDYCIVPGLFRMCSKDKGGFLCAA